MGGERGVSVGGGGVRGVRGMSVSTSPLSSSQIQILDLFSWHDLFSPGMYN